MKLQDLMFKVSYHILYNKYLYFDIERYNSYGNISIQIEKDGKYPDIAIHSIFKSTEKPLEEISSNFIIKEDISQDILVGFIKYIFSDFIKDYKRIK